MSGMRFRACWIEGKKGWMEGIIQAYCWRFESKRLSAQLLLTEGKEGSDME
jgi:hypothetical protein